MVKRTKTPLELGKRERQVYETVVRLGEASVSDVKTNLDQPPSYSAVRATLGFLVDKGWLKHRRDGQRYLYRSAASREKTQRNAARRLLDNFFSGSTTAAIAALLDAADVELSDRQRQEMIEMIQQARKENR
ncbi:BlaI/MecI/CopY family transcriptional regulator [Novipirellula artificiosorum]|uniref:Penicillinase repressor n=1 Tax=Novipirellula artificiosorum TaxID=2528016 RepID=A0A5C6CAS9_9BACT|nr:BlaI/MecI/CopY family transcriptional regulator [Novipirellula artificiosorum]TWU21328.1 Penicillinase repressor [Novipirellula artificiosorum]